MKQLKTCPRGHQYFKSSDCPVCPSCEKEKKPQDGFMASLSAPARRALENNNIKTLEELSHLSEKEVLKYHGLGKSSIPLLKKALHESGLDFIS